MSPGASDAGQDWGARRLHFIAIGGAGMSGLALVCSQLGAEVSGSDRSESSYIERLRKAGLDPAIGHDADQVPEDAEVVVSTAIDEANPELARARERRQRVLHRGQLLAELCRSRRLLAVAGTHGKTTTSAMLVHALRETGADPGFFLGGELPGAGPAGEAANAGWGEGEMDYLLRVVVADMAHYSRFIMNTLLKHPSVQDCKTSFVLDRVKATTAVPL